MKLLFCLLIANVIVFVGCDNPIRGIIKPVIEEIVAEQPPETEMLVEGPAETNYENLPLIESTDLELGQYRMFASRRWGRNFKIVSIGTSLLAEQVPDCKLARVAFGGKLKGLAYCVSDPIRIYLNPAPSGETADGESVLGIGGLDELVVEITKKLGERIHMESGHAITTHEYEGILVKNLTYPDRPIEYEREE